jgi:uncharacterized small protein (DUF1192 family)
MITRPLKKAGKNFSRELKKNKAQKRKAALKLQKERDRTVVLRSKDEVDNALKLVKIEEGQQRIKKLKAETARIEAQTEEIKKGKAPKSPRGGLSVPQCPDCLGLYVGLTECPDCGVELEKVRI